MPWIMGGSAAIMLARPDDAAVATRAKALLDRLAADPANGIAAVLDRAAIARAGANPQAAFLVNLRPGFVTDIFRGASAPLVAPTPVKGMHGYLPGPLHLDATFMVVGPGVAKGRDLGRIDMRAVAPTLAKIIGATLHDAEGKAIDLRP